jgi:hypothetical protein
MLSALGTSCSDSSTAPPGGDAGIGDLAGSGDLSNTDSAKPVDLVSSADAGPCPDVTGAFSVSMSGAGCGDLNTSAPQCITPSGTDCVVQFMSTPTSGAGAVNGQATIQMDGSFTNAALMFGTANRTGCVGSWNAQTSTLTADCGGVGSTQSCIVTLTRTGTNCP